MRRCSTPHRSGTVVASVCAVTLLGTVAGAAAQPQGPTATGTLVARSDTPAQPAGAVADDASDARLPLSTDAVRLALGNRRDDVAFSVRDRRTGAIFTYQPRMRNETASIVKVLILVAAIRERREDGRGLSAREKRLASAMIRSSDNAAASTLMAQAGGSAAVTRVARDLRMRSTTVRGSWGRTTTTAIDQRMLVDALVDGTTDVIGRADRQYVLGLMGGVIDEQRWGVGVVPRGAKAELKNGWVDLGSGGWRVNSIGHVTGNGRDYTLSILSVDNSGFSQGVSLVTKVSRLVYAATGPGAGGSTATAEIVARAAEDADPADLAWAVDDVPSEPAGPAAEAEKAAGSGTATIVALPAGVHHPWMRTRGSAFPPHPWG